MQDHINFLHSKIDTEWSGMLFYKHTKGEISELKDLEFSTVNLFLMDIGSTAATDFKYNKDVVKAFASIEDGDNCLTGLIHSHANMGVFFSGTDMQEINDNGGLYNYYISLVVNKNNDYKCKIAIPIEEESYTTRKYRNTNGEEIVKQINNVTKALLVGDLTVAIQRKFEVPTWAVNRHTEVKELKQKELDTRFGQGTLFGGCYGGFYDRRNNYEEDFYAKNTINRPFVQPIVNEVDDDIPEDIGKTYEFTRSILNCNNDITNIIHQDIETDIKRIVNLPKREFANYCKELQRQLDILHFNVYSTGDMLDEHINDVIILLEDYKHMFDHPRLVHVMEELEEFITI